MRIIRSRQETRERILVSTLALLDRSSAQEFQIRDVAREAGVSASLIIQYFNSKNDLVFEAALRRLESMHTEMVARFAATPPETLDAVVRVFVESDWAIQHIIRDLMALSWWWSSADEARVIEAFRPREAAINTALTTAGVDAGPRRVRAILDAYFAVFRSGCVSGASREDMLADVLYRVARAG